MSIEVTSEDVEAVEAIIAKSDSDRASNSWECVDPKEIIAAAWQVMSDKYAKSMEAALGTIPYARHLVSNMPTWQIHSFLTMFCRNKEEIDAALNSNTPMAIEYRRRVAKVNEATEKADR